MDLTAGFVVISKKFNRLFETRVNSALFTNNLEVGDYYYAKETNTNVINGRYVIKLGNSYKSFIIKDLNTNKMVATINLKKVIRPRANNQYKIDYLFKKLIESNK